MNEEVVALRFLVGAECGCDNEVLAANLKERSSGESELGEDDVEKVVRRFLRLRSQAGVVPIGIGPWERKNMERLASFLSIGISNRSESVMDKVFSLTREDNIEGSGDSSESSPTEISKANKLNFFSRLNSYFELEYRVGRPEQKTTLAASRVYILLIR